MEDPHGCFRSMDHGSFHGFQLQTRDPSTSTSRSLTLVAGKRSVFLPTGRWKATALPSTRTSLTHSNVTHRVSHQSLPPTGRRSRNEIQLAVTAERSRCPPHGSSEKHFS